MMSFPDISPVAFHIFGWPVRWYGLAYLVGILSAWRYCLYIRFDFPPLKRQDLDDLIPWIVGGVIAGGRLGYVLLYHPAYYLSHPLATLEIWRGGMAFHGGLLGVVVSASLYCWRRHIPWRALADCLACSAPLALALGRLANFVNQEMCGRPTDVSWSVVFPAVDGLSRHPSQIYEALTEGVLLFVFLWIARAYWRMAKKPGFLTGLFILGYGVFRGGCEFFRTPEGLWEGMGLSLTSGQLFSLPLVVIGSLLLMDARRRS